MKTPPPPYVGRLAPAPTGALHLGNARTFLVAWLRARQAGGRLVLRLEDLDHPKVKPDAAAQVYEDLRWLGLDWDAGADRDPGFVQSRRGERHRECFAYLRERGYLYPCRCTRRELVAVQSAPHEGDDAPEYRYPNRCRPAGPPGAGAPSGGMVGGEAGTGRGPEPDEIRSWRFRLDAWPGAGKREFVDAARGRRRGDLSAWSGDFVVARSPAAVAYQLAVVIDDHDDGVTEVVRGDDLLPSTERQLALYEAFGWRPPGFCHVPLVAGPDGKRLAKRHGDTRLAHFRVAGVSPGRIVAWLARSLGVAAEGEISPRELLGRFDLAAMPKERPVAAGEAAIRTFSM